MKTTLIFILTFLACFCEAVNVPFTAFNSNEFNVSVPNNSISINTALFPTNGSSLYDSNGAALYQAGLSSNYSLTLSQNGSNYSTQLSQNGTNESLQIGQANTNLSYQIGLANSNLTYQVGLANTNLSNVASNALRLAVLNGSIPSGLATNISGIQTNSTTGNAATATIASNITLLASAPAIAQYNPILWLNPRAIVTTNNLFGVTSVADSSGNGNTFYNDPTAAAPIYSQTGFGGYPCWLMQANWNRSSGAAPTVFYALTNATVWGQVLNTSNFLIVDTFQDTLEANNNFTNNGVKLAGPPFLFSVGNNVQLFEGPAAGSSSGFAAAMNVAVCGGICSSSFCAIVYRRSKCNLFCRS